MVINASQWRNLPSNTVEEIITRHAGHYPPSFEHLVDLLERHRYTVELMAAKDGADATTLHHRRTVYIPRSRPDRMLAMLMHETAECLLRLPVDAEFVHPLTGQDEFHNVATITTRRLQRRLMAECDRLIEQEISAEIDVEACYVAWKQQGTKLVEAGRAMEEGIVSVQFPDPAEILRTQHAYMDAVERLKSIQGRLRYFGR